jgi:hypothetical protein
MRSLYTIIGKERVTIAKLLAVLAPALISVLAPARSEPVAAPVING